jgi:hypothetical protein
MRKARDAHLRRVYRRLAVEIRQVPVDDPHETSRRSDASAAV